MEGENIRMSRLAVFFAEGYEEIEALTVVDVCRRGKMTVDMVSVSGEASVTGAHGISVVMDKKLKELDFSGYDMLILPGGMPGTRNLEASETLMAQLDAFYETGRYIGAICAAPSILGHRGMLRGKRACCYPSFENQLEGAEVTEEPVEVSDNIVTSRGMGTAMKFALTVLEIFCGREQAEKMAADIIYSKRQ